MNDDLERRLRDAISAETGDIPVDEHASLAAIRERAASARRRRLVGATALGAAAALVIGIAIGATVGDHDSATNVASGPSTTIGGDCASTTTGPPSTTGTTSAVVAGNGTTSIVTDPPSTSVPPTEPGLGDGCQDTVPPTTAPSTTVTSTAPSTPTSALPLPRVVFPFNADVASGSAWPWPDPESTAKGFLEGIGVGDPTLGAFQDDGTGAGKIQVHVRDGNGAVHTDLVKTILFLETRGDNWAVTSAVTDSIDVRSVSFDGHTLHVDGYGRGFEGVLHLQVIGHGDVAFHREGTAMASGDMELRPFAATIDVSGSSGQVATLVVSNESGADGGPGDIVALPIQLP